MMIGSNTNTFDHDELLKYWFVVNKGGFNNSYRDHHRVDYFHQVIYN